LPAPHRRRAAPRCCARGNCRKAETCCRVVSISDALPPPGQRQTLDAAASLAENAVAAVVAEVRQEATQSAQRSEDSMAEQFRACFSQLLVPAVQAATQAMLAQMDDAFEKRVSKMDATFHKRLQAMERHEAETAAASSDRLVSLERAVEGMRLEVASLSSSRSGFDEAVSEPAVVLRDVRDDVTDLIRAREYDAALHLAVAAADVDVLMFALEAIGLENLGQSSLRQLTLLCVAQQLGTTLTDEAGLVFKLEALQLSLLAIDKRHAEIAPHVVNVLVGIKAALEALPPNLRRLHNSKVAVLVHVASSLASSA